MKNTVESEAYSDLTLLVDGREAFPEIIRCISRAKETVKINMFIWRDDEIGNSVARAVLDAAERGVKVDITVDRYGVVLEMAEEARRSFFHKSLSLTERIKIGALSFLYPMPGAPRRASVRETALYRAITSHPNISIGCDEFRADHSKYYIIDRETLILGGINIEDKENGRDMQGRVYGDYMVKLVGRAYVDAFLSKLEGRDLSVGGVSFGINTKDTSPRLFEMEKRYLDLIASADRELIITMAYFSPLSKFVRAILDAHRRGARVRIVIPSNANYQSDTNRRAARKLLRLSRGGIEVYLSPRMLHTKLVMTEDKISMGSTNITKKAFGQLSELNLFVDRVECGFVGRLTADVEKNRRLAERVEDYRRIKYNPLKAFIESLLV